MGRSQDALKAWEICWIKCIYNEKMARMQRDISLIGKYLCNVFDPLLLQQLLIKPLGLLGGHFRFISGEQTNLLRVWTLAMGQGTEDRTETLQLLLRHMSTDILQQGVCVVTHHWRRQQLLSGLLTSGWSEPLSGSSRMWRAGWSAESRPGTPTRWWTSFSGMPAELERPFSPKTAIYFVVLKGGTNKQSF